ncbi:hypothetical protein FPV67DRAFT_1410551 [Lyophyllum atratum]|nr:hypothetical protein FPV67DRAFT_1410551 [Lyophyllum atratum]
MARRKNQHKPSPPEIIEEAIKYYFSLGLNDVKIAEECKDHYDLNVYGLSVKSVKRFRKEFNLHSTRQQQYTEDEVMRKILEIRKAYTTRGAETIRKQLRIEHGMRVPRETISKYLRIMEPEAVNQRRARRFKRRRFYAAGVNDVWAQDQHDKWGPKYGLWLHNNIDPFTGFNNWLNVWWTNHNPRLIGGYYIKAVRELGAIPVATQSDPGTENYAVANIHTVLRQRLDLSLQGTLQHIFKHKKTNVKSEANWSVFRRDFAPGYEDLFEFGVRSGKYDINNPLEKLMFQWIAIPWLQTKLDEWVQLRNRTAPRANKHKVLPHGIPILIRQKPAAFNALDFKIPVPMDLVDEVEKIYAPPDHPVFQLTPPEFDFHANQFYSALGRPPVTFDTFWDVYDALKAQFIAVASQEADVELISIISTHRDHTAIQEGLELLQMEEMREGAARVGNEDDGLEHADFTSESEPEGETDDDQGMSSGRP